MVVLTLVILLAAQKAVGEVVVDHDAANKWQVGEWVIHVPKGHGAALKLAWENGLEVLGEVIPDSNEFHVRNKFQSRGKRSVIEHHTVEKRILRNKDVVWAEQQSGRRRTKRDAVQSFNDPFWDKMWYLNRQNDYDMNVQDAWDQGVSGRGVSVTILDDGVEKDHPDLLMNYDPLASTDINDNDSDPQPRYDFSDSNRHGTRCAGQVAASSNNSICAVGIAYNAGIGGIRMLDGRVSDAVEARSLSFNPDHVDIYSSSWGPNDDGKTVDGPGRLATRAFLNGITRGRDGKGSIFVWASGNGGRYKDNCNCDGYATSIYTITVSSTSESGSIPWYSEACSSTLATTYSSGTSAEKQIVTTDLHNSCTSRHTGTSASAPMAAAIIALTLEANPALTWRDVQHVIVRTARPVNLKATDWRTNGMDRKVSHSYGYGLMDTGAMVRVAKDWANVPKQEKCEIHTPYYYKVIPAMGYVTIELEVTDCPRINHLEHVVSKIHISAGKKRGDLRILLESPSGTRSVLLDTRPHDYTSLGFVDWPFMTVHNWGENPVGTWKLTIHNDAYSKWASDAKFFRWGLTLYGIEYDPNSAEYKERQRALKEQKQQEEQSLNERPLRRHVSWHSNFTAAATNQTKDVDPRLNEIQDVSKAGLKSGCISKRLECTQTVEDCRTFIHRKVAQLFCKCSQICSDVASTTADFNLQCSYNESTSNVRVIPDKSPPMYCSFIPFFSYN